MKKYTAVFFDLDGTLTDPEEGITHSIAHALRYYGIEEPQSVLRRYIGPPLEESLSRYVPAEEVPAAIAHYREYFAEKGILENTIYRGIADMLAALKARGFIIGMATSKPEPFARRIAEHFGIEQYFDDIAGATLDGKLSKKKDVLALALQRLSLSPRQCVMVGDREHDVLGAKALNIDAVGVLYGFGSERELKEAGAAHICTTVESLQNWLLASFDQGQTTTETGEALEPK